MARHPTRLACAHPVQSAYLAIGPHGLHAYLACEDCGAYVRSLPDASAQASEMANFALPDLPAAA